MSDKIKWDVWGHKVVIEAETEDEAAAIYIRTAKYTDNPWRAAPRIQVEVHQSIDNAALLKRERDEYKRKYEAGVRENEAAREALDKIHETLDGTNIYNQDD